MVRKTVWQAVFAVFVGVLLLPALAHAQSAITGTVKDTSGAAMPGVTVEAASPVLIEKVKTTVTDADGSYRIADLRPGTYTVTFTLPGFNTFKRDGLQLPAEFTATLNAELGVGALNETITVTGSSPVVDVTTAAKTQVLDREAIDAIPTGRSIQGMAQLVVGVNLNLPDTGGARAMQQTYMSTHGMSTSNTSVLVDGQMVNGLQSDGAIQSYFNDAMNSEVSYQTSAINADTSAGGVRLNMIPREGGNRWSGDFKAVNRPGAWQSSNLTDRHKQKGLTTGNAIDRVIDYTFALGGPIQKDKLWVFSSARYFSVNNYIANTYMKDGSKGIDDQFIRSAMARLTWQVTPRNKITGYFDEIDKYRGHDMQANYVPEEAGVQWFSPDYHTTAIKWTSPVTSRLFLEAGWSSNMEYYTNSYQDGIEQPVGTAAWYANAARNELDLGGVKTAALTQTTESPAAFYWNAAATYVTGDHTIKIGANNRQGHYMHTRLGNNADLVQQYRSSSTGVRWSVPDSVLIRNTPLVYGERLNRDLGLFVQDSWHLNRLTANVGLRYEVLNSSVMAGESGAGRFVPARTFPEIKDVPAWKDIAPRAVAGLRPVRQRPHGREVLDQPLQPVAHDRHRGELQPAAVADGHAAVARRQRRRHRPGREGLRRLPEHRLRDLLRGPVVELRHRGAEHLRRLSPHVELRAGRRGAARADGRPLGERLLVARRLPQPDDDDEPVVVAQRLHALHLVQPDDGHSPSRSTPAAPRRRRGRPTTSTPWTRTARTSTSRSTSRAAGAFPAAARSSAAWRSSASASRPARRPTTRTTSRRPPATTTAWACATTSRTTSRIARASSCRARGRLPTA